MAEQNQRKREKNICNADGVAKKNKSYKMLHEERTTFKNTVAQSVQRSLAQAVSAKVQPTQPIQRNVANPKVAKPNCQEHREKIMTVCYCRHLNDGEQEESTSSRTPPMESVAVTQKGDGQNSADDSNSGKQDLKQIEKEMEEHNVCIGSSPISQETVQKLVLYLWDVAKRFPSFLKLNEGCKIFREDENILIPIKLLGDEVKHRLFQDAISEDKETVHMALAVLYQFEIPITKKVEEKIGFYGQVNDQQLIEEYLSEDQSFCLGLRDPKTIFEFFEELSETRDLTFSVSDLTELFIMWRQRNTCQPLRSSYVEKRIGEVLSNFKMALTSNMDLAVKVMMLTDLVVDKNFKKRARDVGVINCNLQNKIILYQPHFEESGKVVKAIFPQEVNRMMVHKFFVNVARPLEELSLTTTNHRQSIERNMELVSTSLIHSKINSLMALKGLRRALMSINETVFQPFLVLVEAEMNSTPETMEVEIGPMEMAMKNFLLSMKDHITDVGPFDDKFPAGPVYISLTYFISGLKCASLQDIFQELLSEKEIHEATVKVLPREVCCIGLTNLFYACK